MKFYFEVVAKHSNQIQFFNNHDMSYDFYKNKIF